MPESLSEAANRYAKAIWQAEVDAGNCSTSWPLSVALEQRLLAAGHAAAGVLSADVYGPVSEEMRNEVGSLRDVEHAKRLFGNFGFGVN